MIWDSRDSCQNLESQDSQPERAGKFPEIDEHLARNGCGCTAPSIGLCPGARRHVKDTSWSWPYGSWSLSAHSALHLDLGFSLSAGKVIALGLTGWSSPLTHHHAALWNEALAVVSWWRGVGRKVVPELSTWHSLNVGLCNLQVIWDSWAMWWKSHSLPPSSSWYKIEYVINSVHC